MQKTFFTKQKQTHILKGQTYACCGEGWQKGLVREFGWTGAHCYV